MRKGLFYYLLIFLITSIVMTMKTEETQAMELAPHLYKTVFDNGQTVVVKETPGTKVVTVQIWVKAGSVYEESHEAGITHFIEHMIFKGTSSRGPGELAQAIEAAGGRINAYTSYEYTVYHATLSAEHWGMALDILAESILDPAFDPVELEREKKVILEEVGMRNDRPNVKLFQELMGSAYGVHPYRLPVIGNVDSIKEFSREDVLAYMDKHYHPDNFTVVVVGDVVGPEVIERVRTLLGGLEQGEYKQPPLPVEPTQEGARFFMIRDDINQPHMALALPISRFDSPDTPVLDVLAEIVGHGEVSRLYRSLRDEKKLVYGISGSAFTPHDPGMFEIAAVLEGDKMMPALEAVLIELFRLKYFPVSDQELKRAKHNLESDFVFSLEGVEGQARVLGSFDALTGDPREEEYLASVRSVGADDIMRVANTYFTGEHLTAGFLVPKGSDFKPDKQELAAIIKQAELEAGKSAATALLPDASLSGLHRFELDNGIRLLVREDQTVPTVAIRAVFPGGLRSETPASNGAFAFISELLPKGTKTMSAHEITLTVADMAGRITGFHGKNTFGLKADFLARFTGAGLELVSDIIKNPAFDDEEAAKIRPELLAHLKQQEDSLTALAFREFNSLLFDGHPYGLNSSGSQEVISMFTTAALKEIYEQHARPGMLVLAVAGAVQADKIYEQVQGLFKDWRGVKPAEENGISEDLLPPEPPVTPKTARIVRDKEQVHLIIGFVGTTLYDHDRYSLEVLETVLSGQSGRLFTELRDKQGLAYSLSSFSMLGLDTGAFGIYMGTSPDKKEKAVRGVWQEINRIRQDLISDAELARAKNVLIGQYELGMQTHSSQALEIALNETYDLGQDFGNRYIESINEVDAESVRQVALKYILPERYVMVEVGAEDPAGKQ